MHSTHSYDGKVTLKDLKQLLQSKGVSFACMSEHTDYLTKETAAAFVNECRNLSDENFIFIPGFEVPYQEAHVLHLGATEFISATANKAQLQLWRKVSPLVILAHPVRNHFKVDETLEATLDGIEVWNQQYDGKAAPRVRSLSLLKKMRQNKPLLAIGGLDFHRLDHFGQPLINLEIESLTEESILNALKNGRFTFGYEDCLVSAIKSFQPTLKQQLFSFLQINIIRAGKAVNKNLAKVGLHLPKRFTVALRSRV